MRGKMWGARFAMLTVAGLALAACAGGDDAAEDQAATEEPAAEAPAPAADPAAPAANLPEGVTADMVAQGQQLFTGTGNCASCHGMDAKGTTLAPNLTDSEWLWITNTADKAAMVTEIQNQIKTGTPQPKQFPSPMPPMGGATLTDEQVHHLAAYIVSLGG